MIGLVLHGIFIGIVATIGVDLWAAVARHALRLPTADWAMVGRWFGHMPKGQLTHRRIASASAIPNEFAIGWIAHYAIGILYGLAYLLIVNVLLNGEASFVSAMSFGLATLVAPWLVMQPAMGAGVFASRAPKPAIVRLVNLSMHAVFGVSLYLGFLLVPQN